MKYDQTPFALAPESFARAMPNPVEVSEEDLAKIELPGWRYDQIMEAVLSMYDKVDAHLMPLPVFDIANGLGYSVVPYRAYGTRLYEVLLKTSEDALTLQFWGSTRPIIMYNDRRPPKRINWFIEVFSGTQTSSTYAKFRPNRCGYDAALLEFSSFLRGYATPRFGRSSVLFVLSKLSFA